MGNTIAPLRELEGQVCEDKNIKLNPFPRTVRKPMVAKAPSVNGQQDGPLSHPTWTNQRERRPVSLGSDLIALSERLLEGRVGGSGAVGARGKPLAVFCNHASHSRVLGQGSGYRGGGDIL